MRLSPIWVEILGAEISIKELRSKHERKLGETKMASDREVPHGVCVHVHTQASQGE